jgi:DNA repair protein RecN (Recombination protein N)
MLRELSVRDFTIIETLRVEFKEGLNVLTGETGAGKSILVDALCLALGERAQAGLVAAGKKEAVVEAFFDVPDGAAGKAPTAADAPNTDVLSADAPNTDVLSADAGSPADALGIDTHRGIIVRRIIAAQGKNRVYLNDSMVGIQSLQEICAGLVDVHGQHEHQSLMLPEKQMRFVDALGRTGAEAAAYAAVYEKRRRLLREKHELSRDLHERARRIDLLGFQVDEIDSAMLKTGERETLEADEKFLSNLTAIKDFSENAYDLLYAGENSIGDRMSKVEAALARLAGIDPRAGDIHAMAGQVKSFLGELTLELRRYKDNIEPTGDRLDEVVTRLETIKKLEKKYGRDIAAVIAYKENAARQLDALLLADETLGALDEDLERAEAGIESAARLLSEKRAAAARKLEKEVTAVLKDLSFEKARFEIEILKKTASSDDDAPRYTPTGVDSVEFLFSANPGQPPKPIQKVASGGELSRLMLALKSVFADFDEVPVLVFDEVDAGIGGRTAQAVAEKLKKLSRGRQVLCVTHLPQIAARADNHIRVIKDVRGDRVGITVETLEGRRREEEIARMLGGTITETSLRHARELIEGE